MAQLRWLAAALICGSLALAAPARAAPAWLSSFPVNAPGTDAGQLRVAFGQNGDAGAIWRQSGSTDSVQVALRPAGGSFGAPQLLDPNGFLPQIGIDANGNPVAVWLDGSSGFVKFSRAAAGGAFADGVSIPGQTTNAAEFSLAVAPSGEAISAWRTGNGISVSFAAPGGPFGPSQDFAASNASDPQVAIAPSGEAVLAYMETGAHSLLEAAVRPPGGVFATPVTVSASGEDAEGDAVAINAAGQGVVVWPTLIVRPGPTFSNKPEAVFLAAGSGSFSSIQDISGETPSVGSVNAAVLPDGTVRAVWTPGNSSGESLLSATAPQGGPFGSSPQTLSTTPITGADVASDPAGDMIAVWLDSDGTNNRAAAAVAPAGQPFGSSQLISPAGRHARNAVRVAMDGQGDAIASWPFSSPSLPQSDAEVAGYDAAGPQLRSLSIPSVAEANTATSFAVSPLDVWSPVASVSWYFGDGQSSGNPAASHTYGTAGAVTASVTATDSLGNATTAAAPLSVGPDRTMPVISNLGLSRHRFRAAARGASLATAVGTTIRFTLSEGAAMRFGVERCAKLRHHRCRRYKLVKRSSFGKSGKVGANRARFTGRVRRHKLTPGLYRLRVQAVDKAGNKSKLRRLPFQIVRR